VPKEQTDKPQLCVAASLVTYRAVTVLVIASSDQSLALYTCRSKCAPFQNTCHVDIASNTYKMHDNSINTMTAEETLNFYYQQIDHFL
jgi:hypothetical protein